MAPKLALLRQQLYIAFFLCDSFVTTPVCAEHPSNNDPNPSPQASASLICPNEDPSNCYPTLFQPTTNFQKIRPNQSLPPGLHVRLNIQTGEKEARLNVPGEDEGDKEAVVVVDNLPHILESTLRVADADESPLQLRLQDAPKQAEHARPYTPPRPVAPVDPNEAFLYKAAVTTLREKFLAPGVIRIDHDADTADTLETLTELAHSLEWGLSICRDVDLRRSLLESISTPEDNIARELRSAILLLLATAIQNNADALNALLECYGVSGGCQEPLSKLLTSLAAGTSELRQRKTAPSIVAREVFFLSQLCTHKRVMQAYLTTYSDEHRGCFPNLLELFTDSYLDPAEGIVKVNHRIANFVEDHAEQLAAIYSTDHHQTDRTMIEQIQASLQPWCAAFSLKVHSHENDDRVGSFEAKREVERVLKVYTGKGCHGDMEPAGPEEL